jgi:formylmethanofuran dehydrogenase subunit C
MKGGKIVVDGNVGSDSGCYVRGGLIKIKGNAGPFFGFHMSDGTVQVEKNAGPRLGANMVGGKLIVGGTVEAMMPTFTIDGTKPKVKIDDTETAQGPFYVFLGDLAEKGTGKIFVSKANNPQLKEYEKYL